MATISFNTTFDLSSGTPNILFTDTTNWAGQGISLADVRGDFTITSPSNIVVYNNTDYTAPGCDIDIVSSLESQQTIIAPNTSGIVESGTYTIQYDVFNSDTEEFYTVTNTYDFQYVAPTIAINQTVDCVSPLFTSQDITNYTVAGVLPTITRTHTLYFPNGSAGQGSPLVTSSATINTGTFYNNEQTTVIVSELEYVFDDDLIVIDEITGNKSIVVDCSYICGIYCCIRSVEQQMIDVQFTNSVLYAERRALFNQIMAFVGLAKLAIECGKSSDVNGYLDQIRVLSNCTEDCACTGDEPSLVIGLGGVASVSVVESGGSPVEVTPSTVGNTTTYTVSLSSTFVNLVNSFLNTDIVVGDHLSVSSSTVGVLKTFTINTETTPIAYADLLLKYNNEELTPGFYQITDFQYSGIIPFAGETILGPVEQLIIQAVSNNEFASEVYSPDFPQDIIRYEIIDTSTQGNTMGRITYRKDTEKNLEGYFDIRNALFRRWETSLGSGIFTEFTDPGGGEAYQDAYAFVPTNSSFLFLGDCSGDHLPNIIIKGNSQNIRIEENCTNMNIGSNNSLISMKNNCTDITIGNNSNAIIFGYGVNAIVAGTALANVYLENYCNTVTFGNSCSSITMNACTNITFGNSCIRNTLGYTCDSITFGVGCNYNTLGSNNTNFTIGAGNTNLKIGDSNDSLTTGTTCAGITIGSNTLNIVFGNGSNDIVIGNAAASLQFGLNASSLRISDNCSTWSAGNDVFGIVAESGVNSMNFGNSCSNMTFGTNVSGLIFTAGATNNYFAAGISSIDFTGATHVYAAYDCNIFVNATPAQRLSYIDAADVLTVVNPTA